ncbi:S-methyl-5-thioribose-1-phosphate isomerase [Rhizina undulata]
MSALQAIKYTRGSLSILDQLKLPHESIYVPIRTSKDGFHAIKRMVVRGAPAIAIVAALSLAVELDALESSQKSSAQEAKAFIFTKLEYLLQSRPTAVNLGDAAGKLKKIVSAVEGSGQDVVERYVAAAERMLVDDVQDNENIGKFGAEWILQNARTEKDGKVSVLTHCNTGSLATAGYGTALGVIRSLHSGSNLTHAYCTETRPYNQGSRLTAYELVHEKIPSTLITDSMAASLLRAHPIASIVVGADRVAANGDTANKIGTYQLAILARYHNVKFIVAAPTTSIDLSTKSGDHIVIEQRPGKEVVMVRGPVVQDASDEELVVDVNCVESVYQAARGIGVYNPSFDVTPKDLIDAIVTEKGVAVKDEAGNFDLKKFF